MHILIKVSKAIRMPVGRGSYALLLMLAFAFSVHAQTSYTSTGSGNWGSSSTWSPSGVPTATDNVTIQGGHNVTVNISNAACASLDIGDNTKSTATLTFAANSKLTVTGTITFGGNGNALRMGAMDMTYGGHLVCSGFSISNFSSFTPGFGTVELKGSSTIPSAFTNFNILKISGGSNTVSLGSSVYITDTLILSSGTFATGTNLSMSTGSVIQRDAGSLTGTLQGTADYHLDYRGSAKTIGPENTGSGLQDLHINMSSGQALTLGAALVVNDVYVNTGTLSVSTHQLTISGNLAVTSTLTGSAIVRMTGNGMTLSGTGTINSTDSLSFISGPKTISSGSNLTISSPINIIGGITVTNNGTITSTSTAGIQGSVLGSTFLNGAGATLNITGSLLPTGTLVAAAAGNTIHFTGTTGNQNIKTGTYHHLNINKPGFTGILDGNITVNGDLSITAGSLDVSTSNYAITLKGDLTNNGLFTQRSGTVSFTGTSAQSITGSSLTEFYNLTLNNSSGLTLSSGNTTVNNNLTLSSGLLYTSSYKVSLPASASISSASSSSYLNGTLEWSFPTGSNVNRTFHVGTGTKYLPVTLDFGSVTNAGTISVKATDGEHPQVSSSCISSVGSLNAYWTFTNSGVAPASYTTTFNYGTSHYDAGAFYEGFILGRYSSGWAETVPTSVTDASLSKDAITGFGDFAIGEKNPKFNTQPANSVVCNGDNTSFTVNATGTSVSYQWQLNTGSGWSNISDGGIYGGATTSALNLTGVSVTMDGYQYRCYATVSGGCTNSDTSQTATLGFASSFSITVQPLSVAICAGEGTTFSTSASGAVSGYQWQLSVNGGSSWSNISNTGIYSGATTSTLSISSVSAGMNTYRYRCIVQSNCVANDTTDEATITTQTAPSISAHPSNITTCEAANTNFSVTATGTNLAYQWQESTDGGNNWSNITDGGVYANTTNSTITLTNIPLSYSSYQYRCQVSGTCTPPVISNAATLSLNARPSITSHPLDATMFYNTNRNASFSASATGFGTLTYQWQADTGSGYYNLSNGGVYSGVTTTTLNITNASIGMDGTYYRCMVSGSCSPSQASNGALLNISFHFTVSTNTIWSSLSPVPTSSSTMEIMGSTLTVDVADAVVGSIQIGRKSGGAGTLSFNSGSQLSVFGPGANIVLGEQNRAGSINMINGGKLACKGFVVNNLGTWTSGSGTLEITGTHTLNPSFTSFNNLLITGSLVTLGGNSSIAGSLEVDTFSTLSNSTYTLSVGGNLKVNGTFSGSGTITLNGSGAQISGIGTLSNTSTLSITNAKTIAPSTSLTVGGTIALSSGVTVTNNGILTSTAAGGITGGALSSTWVNASGATLSVAGPLLPTGTLTATASNNTVKYTGISSGVTVKPTAYYNLAIDKASQTATLGSAATVSGTLSLDHGTLAAGSNLTIGNLGTIKVGAGNMTGTLQGSNTYDVLYVDNSKTTGTEFTGSGLRDVTISLLSGETVTLGSSFTTGRNLTITSGNLDVSSNNYTITLNGNFNNTGGSFIPRSGSVTFSGSSAQSISGSATTSFYNLTLSNSNGVTLSSPAQVSGTMSLSAGTFAAGTHLTMMTDGTIGVGDGIMTGTIQGNNPYNVSYLGSSKATGAELSGSNVRDITINVNSGQAVTLSSAVTVNRNLTINANTTLDISASNYALNIKGNFINNGTFNARNGKVTFNGTTAQAYSGNTAAIFHKLFVSNASGLTLSNAIQVNDTLSLVAGALTAGSYVTLGTGATIARSGGSFSGTLQGSNAFDAIYTGNSKITGAILANAGLRDLKVNLIFGQTLTLSANTSLSRNLTITSGALDVSTGNYALDIKGNFFNNGSFAPRSGTLTFSGTGPQLINGSTATTFNAVTVNKTDSLKLDVNTTIGGALTLMGGVFSAKSYTLTLSGSVSSTGGSLASGSTGTIHYNQSTDGQSVLAANYGNLTFSNYNKILASSGTIAISGTFTPGTATGHTVSGSTVDLNGTAQDIPSFTFNNLNISGGDIKTLTGGNTTVNGSLTFNSGKVVTGSNVLIIGPLGTVGGASASNYVSGNLRKHIQTGSDVTASFEIGNASNYVPLHLEFSTVSAAGYITASTTDGDHAQIASSCIDQDKSVNRTWTLAGSGGITFTNYNATATFATGDIDGSTNYNNFRIAVYNSSWVNPTPGTTTSTSTSADGITTLGDIQMGEANPTAVTVEAQDTTVCDGSGTAFSISAIGTGLSYQWQEYDGNSWSNLSDNDAYSGATTAALNIAPVSLNMSGYKYRSIVSADCTPNDTSAEVSLYINPTGLWLGAVSSDWHTAANWCGGVPNSSTDVVIASVAPNMPVSSSAVIINKLTIQSGASLTMGSDLTIEDSLVLNGSLSIGSNTLTFNGHYDGNGTLTGSNSSNLSVGGTAGIITLPSITLNNLTINRSSGANMAGNITIKNILTLTDGSFNVGANQLTLEGGNVAGIPANLTTTSASTLEIGGNTSNLIIPASVTNLRKLIVNNNNGVSLGANLIIHDSLVFEKGILYLGIYNLSIGNTGTITGYDSTQYVATPDSATLGGKLKRFVNNNDTYVYYPVGSENGFSPVKIKLTNASAADNFTVRVFDKAYSNGTNGSKFNKYVLNKTWMIDEETSGGSNATIDVGWRPADQPPRFRPGNSAVSHFMNSKWNHGSAFTSNAVADGARWRSLSGVTSFSPFTVVDDSATANVPVNVKVYLEGAYDTGNSSMNTALNSQGFLPLSQPYNMNPWNYAGTESLASVPNAQVVDWILVELRNAPSAGAAVNATTVATKAGLLLSNGDVVDVDGITPLTFNIMPSGNYFIFVYHRNHLSIMSSSAMTFATGMSYDFTTTANKVHNTCDVVQAGAVFAMPAGTVESATDMQIDANDTVQVWSDRNTHGYKITDCNMDGVVDATDRTIILNNLGLQCTLP